MTMKPHAKKNLDTHLEQTVQVHNNKSSQHGIIMHASANATSTMAPPTPSTLNVLLSTELLERIFTHLPMKDLLLSQRVCGQWRDVIKRSRELQQKSFLLPREAQAHWRFEETFPDECGFERWTLDKVGGGGGGKGEVYDAETVKEGVGIGVYYPSAELNPLWFVQLEMGERSSAMFAATQGGRERFTLRQQLRVPPSRLLEEFPEGTWRSMFVTQPPVRSLSYQAVFGDGEIIVDYFRDDGHNIIAEDVFARIALVRSNDDWTQRMECGWFATDGLLFATAEELEKGHLVEDACCELDTGLL